MPHKVASRSTHGCWTCRLRKKKCDENHPSCFRCTYLETICDGYGPRPYWMDRGALQREQAGYKKRIIAQIKSAKRINTLPNASQHVESESDAFVLQDIATSTFLHAHPTKDTLSQGGLGRRADFQLLGSDGDLYANSEPIWSEAMNSANFPTELFYDQTAWNTTSDDSRTLSTSVCSATRGRNVQSPIDVSRSNVHYESNMKPMDPLYDPILTDIYSSDLSGYNSEVDWPLTTQTNSSLSCTDLVSQPAGLNDPILYGDMEDILFMYYFDHVFYIYCPFYFPFDRRGRGWLLSILKRVSSAYHAALLLGEYHHSASTQHNSSYSGSARGGHYDMALQELQISLARSSAWSGSLGLTHSVEVLTTILHLLFYEVRSYSPSVIFNANLSKHSRPRVASIMRRYISGQRILCFHRLCKHR